MWGTSDTRVREVWEYETGRKAAKKGAHEPVAGNGCGLGELQPLSRVEHIREYQGRSSLERLLSVTVECCSKECSLLVLHA